MATATLSTYEALLRRAAKRAVAALAEGLSLPRSAAAEAFAAAAGLVLAGLARHRRKRSVDPTAAATVVAKYGRPADVDAPALAIGAHLAAARLDPRLGGLLGDATADAAAWLHRRTGAPPEALSRALAASAPLALGALGAAAGQGELMRLLEGVGEEVLSTPERLLDRGGACGHAFLRVRRAGRPRFWRRG